MSNFNNNFDVNNTNTPLFSDDVSFQDFEFDSFSDFTDIGGEDRGMTNNGVSSINVEEYAFQELDLDAKYRSIQSINPGAYNTFTPSFPLSSSAPPQLSKASLFVPHSSPNFANNDQFKSKATPPVIVVKSNKTVTVPDEPFYIAATQFSTDHSIETVVSMIENEFNNVLEVSFEFFPQKCRWECVYLCGPTRCKFEFNVYRSGTGTFTVEGNRLCGDNVAFSGIFRSLRQKFSSEVTLCTSPTSVMDFQHIPLPEMAVELTSQEIAAAMAPILAMVTSGICESQVCAAQIFCDLSMQQNMHEVMCGSECVNALVSLVRVEFDYCNQHAVCALANLSSSRSCQEILVKDGAFLLQMLQLCSNGSFNTAEMRRECARLLANICSVRTNAMRVVQAVGEDDVTSWLHTVDGLVDERLRLHAERAKNALHTCLA